MSHWAGFAELLDYPAGDLAARARALAARIGGGHPAAAHLERFAGMLPGASALEELYTRTFDLAAACPPYVGHQLLGEDGRRSLLLASLAGRFRERRFEPGGELPDHLCVLLRFLAGDDTGEEADDLIAVCMAPAVTRMVDQLGDGANPYHAVLRALLAVLEDRARPRS